ncbi:hypothetical protein [Ruegeria meonggei]|uniref:hypothetical protein n=1 Tax=Ruegeria meonggei TaxID=1446476 RepID=UPI00366CD251
MESVALLTILVVMIMLGAPVGFVMILIPVAYILITDAAPMILIPSQMFQAIELGAADGHSFLHADRRAYDFGHDNRSSCGFEPADHRADAR